MERQLAPLPTAPTAPDEVRWIALARGGDRAAFGRLVARYQRPIYNLCYRLLHDSLNAEDAAQEVFLRAYLKLESYNDAYRFSTWLFAIASHYCLDWLKHRRLPLVDWEVLAPGQRFEAEATPQPEPSLLKAEEVEAVQTLLRSLKADYRLLVILKYWSDLSYDEIGLICGLTTSAVKSKLFRARRTLARAAIGQRSAVVPLPWPQIPMAS